MLRAIIGFDHCARNKPEAGWLSTCGYNLTRRFAVANKELLINDDAALSCQPGTATGNPVLYYLDMAPFMPTSGYGLFVISFRHKTLVAGNTGPLMYITTDSAGTNHLLVANYSHLPNVNVGSEVFVEILFDLNANAYATYVDGNLAVTAAITGVVAGLIRSGQFIMAGVLTSTGTAGLAQHRDLFLTDDVAGDGYTNRIGPRTVYPVTLDSAAGVDWTSSDGSALLTALNVPIETTGAATLSSGASKSPLVVGLKPTTLNPNANIEGISIMAAGKSDVNQALTGVTLTNSGKFIKGQSKVFGTALRYGVPLGVYARAPDGARWTAASIDATTVSLTPDVVS